MKRIVSSLIVIIIVTLLFGCDFSVEKNDREPLFFVNNEPKIHGVEDIMICIDDEFDPMDGVYAYDEEDGNITDRITISTSGAVETTGSYTITYTVSDNWPAEVSKVRVVSFCNIELEYPTGFYNFRSADSVLRHTFVAAAEKYLMNNMYGGVPLFANGSYSLYSSRLQLPVDEYIPVLGYASNFGTMTEDDSTVIMYDGNNGEVGEYTYRTSISTNPGTFNQWLYDTSTDSTLMEKYYDSLFVYELNTDKSGYSVNPSMASMDPLPISPTITESGKRVSYTWRIKLRDDLEWKYHPNTDISNFPEGHEVIDANDFVDTYKLALTEQWFRAVSGGGDFFNNVTRIKNAQEYVNGSADWEDVGIKLIDDLTFELTFNYDMSDWDVRYMLSSFSMTPISIELYDALGETVSGETFNPYGTSNETIAYHGGYYVDEYVEDNIIIFNENNNYHSPNDFFYTGYTYEIIEDAEEVYQAFIDEKLEGTSVPTALFDTHKDNPRLKSIPGATIYRLMINGLGSVENQKEQFPDSDWIPEPLLANQDFKMAMFHALDRRYLAEELLSFRTPTMYYFSEAYLIDAELGIPYRKTEQGQSVGEGLSPATLGFNFDAARAYYLNAVDALIEDGDIIPGTIEDPTIINIEINNYTNSDSWTIACEYIKTAYESAFKDSRNHVNVTFTVHEKDFPAIYYDHMMVGEFDLSVGGLSGSAYDASSFLDVYSSDNRGGFTTNWGIDTSLAEIEVIYTDYEGNNKREMWSYDAISSALNGEIYISKGAESTVPAAKDIEVTPTTVTFNIDQFDNPEYENIIYTIQWYDNAEGRYYDVEGNVDIPATTETITVEGLLPFYYGYTNTGELLYQGDYQIIIKYEYVLVEEKEGEQYSHWFEMGIPFEIVEDSKVADMTSVVFGMIVNQEDVPDRTLTSLKISTEDSEGNYVPNLTAIVDITDINAISVIGLDVNSNNRGLVTFSDGTIYWVSLHTKDIAEIETIVVTDTSAELVVTIQEEYTETVTSVIVYHKSDDTVVGNVDITDLDKIIVTGLTEETNYYIIVEFSDAEEREIDFITDSTPK